MLVSCGIEGNGARGQLFADQDRTVGLRRYTFRAIAAAEKRQRVETRKKANNNAGMEVSNSHVNKRTPPT